MSYFEQRKSEICGHLLVKASRLFFSKSVRDLVEKYNLNISEHHFRVFPYISHEGSTITEIAKQMKISKQAVSKLVKTLVDEKILYFSPGSDGREKLVKFKTGKKSSFDNSLNYLEGQEKVFEEILGSSDDLKQFKSYLLKIQNYYEGEV